MRTFFDENLLLSQALREHLDNRASGEGGGGQWWFAARRANREPIEFASHQFGRPYAAKTVFAHDMCAALNRHLDHGGTWIVVWTHPVVHPAPALITLDGVDFQTFHFVWLDGDGDPQFGIICDDSFLDVVKQPPEKWLDDAEEGYRRYCEIMRIIDPSPRQRFMAARGERVPAQH